MYYSDTYDKIIFMVIMCSSFFNFAFTMSMNKAASLFKLLGAVFFIPFIICCSGFLFAENTPASLVISISELCLSAVIFLLMLHAYNDRNYNVKLIAIFAVSTILAAYASITEQFILCTFSYRLRSTLIAIFITASLLLAKKKKVEQKISIPLIIWLAGIVLGFNENHAYIKHIVQIAKLTAYSLFSVFFYKIIYKSYSEKIKEAERLIESMKHSMNKEVRKRIFEIERSNERLLEMTKTDLLTKAFNKITILNIIERLINSKKNEVFSILMFDIDNFKTINDSFGHVTGDLCLKTLANIASNNIREVDYLGRYGGDEFIIVLPTLAENEARFVAERFKKKVNETSNPKFTVSIGIATYPYDGYTVKDLISAADKGLYKSKSRGKNTISHASEY